jgi:hypothetical protein
MVGGAGSARGSRVVAGGPPDISPKNRKDSVSRRILHASGVCSPPIAKALTYPRLQPTAPAPTGEAGPASGQNENSFNSGLPQLQLPR